MPFSSKNMESSMPFILPSGCIVREPVAPWKSLIFSMEKPYVRLCADILAKQPHSFDDLRPFALKDFGDAVFLLGEIETELLPYAKQRLAEVNFPYSSLEVDGIKNNNRLNIALWMTKSDLDKITPKDFDRALAGLSIAELCSKVDVWEDAEAMLKDPEKIAELKEYAQYFGRDDPPLLYQIYRFSVNSLASHNLVLSPFREIPPNIWHFYGGKPMGADWEEFSRQVRNNIHSFDSRAEDILLKLQKKYLSNYK
jgi:hypothetical protein